MTSTPKRWTEVSRAVPGGDPQAVPRSKKSTRKLRLRDPETTVATPAAELPGRQPSRLDLGRTGKKEYGECIAYRTTQTYQTTNKTGPRGVKKAEALIILSPSGSVFVQLCNSTEGPGEVREAKLVTPPHTYQVVMPSGYGMGKYVCRFETHGYYEVLQAGLRALKLGDR